MNVSDASPSQGGNSAEKDWASKAALLDGGAVLEERVPIALRLQSGIFGAFRLLNAERAISATAFYVLQVFAALQLLLFALGPFAPWRVPAADSAAAASVLGTSSAGASGVSSAASVVTSFQTFLLSVTFVPWPSQPGGQEPPYSRLTLWALSVCYVLATLALFARLALRSAADLQHSPTSKRRRRSTWDAWATPLLRLLTALSLYALAVPLAGNLLSPMICTTDSSGALKWAGLTCWQPAHIAAFAFTLACLCGIVSFLIVSSALFVVRTPSLKRFPMASAHGRADLLGLVIKLLLTVVFVAGTTLSAWVHALINLVGALGLLALQVYYLPYFDMALNRFLSMAHAVFVASCIAALLAVALSANTSDAFAAAVGGLIWAFLVPLFAYIGNNIADASWRALGKSKDLSSPYLSELRMRWLLFEVMRLAQVARPGSVAGNGGGGTGGGGGGGADDAGGSSGAVVAVQMDDAPDQAGSGSGAQGGKWPGGASCPAGFSSGAPPPGHGGGDGGGGEDQSATGRIPTARSSPAYGVFGTGLDLRASTAGLVQLTVLHQLLTESLATFPNSALMRLFAAHVTRAVQGNPYLERLHLRAAEMMSDSSALDVRFFSQSRQSQLHEEDAQAAVGRMTVELRLFFDNLQETAEQKVAACRNLILSFWTLLCDRKPDLSALQAKGSAIYSATREAEAVFKELLDIVPTCVPVMRAYADFLIDVSNNPRLASELMTDADQLEDEASKAHTMRHSVDDFIFGSIVEFNMGADGVGLLKISARTDLNSGSGGGGGDVGDDGGGGGNRRNVASSWGLGVVTQANFVALKLLGFTGSHRELLGREMSLLCPPPVQFVHARYLSSFVATGTQRITGSSRMLFAMHRAGYMLACKAHVQIAGDQWLVALEEIPAPHISFLWVQGAGSNWRITAACRRSFSTLGITVPTLRSGNVSLSTFLSDTSVTMRNIVANPGLVVQLKNLASGVTHSSSFIVQRGQFSGSANTTSGFFTAFAQELTVPYVPGSIFILKLITATSSELRAAVAAGQLNADALGLNSGPIGAGPGNEEVMGTNEDSDEGGGESDGSMSVGGSDDDLGGSRDSEEDGSGAAKDAKGGAARFSGVKRGASPPPSASVKRKGVAFEEKPSQPEQAPPKAVTLKPVSSSPAVREEASESAQHVAKGLHTTAMEQNAARVREKLELALGGPAGGTRKDGDAAPSRDHGEGHHGKGGRPGGGASVASGGSQNSSNSHLSPSELLRRGVKARSQKLEASLVRLRASLLIVFAIVCITNITSYVVTQVLTQELLNGLSQMRDNSRRTVLVQRAAATVQLLVAAGDTSQGFPLYDFVEGYDWSREQLRTSVAEVAKLHDELFLIAQASSQSALNEYVQQIWPVIDLVPSTYVDRDTFSFTTRNVSLADVVIEFVMRVHTVWWYAPSAFVASDQSIFWIERNAPFSVMAALNTSLFLSSSTSAGLTDTVQLANNAVLAVALSVFLLVTAFAIVPGVLEVIKEQREIFDVFGMVPVKVMRHLRDALAERIAQLQRQASGEEDGAMGSGGAGETPNDADKDGANAEGGGGGGAEPEVNFAATRLRGAGLAAAVANARATKKVAQADAEVAQLVRRAATAVASSPFNRALMFAGCGRCAQFRVTRAAAVAQAQANDAARKVTAMQPVRFSQPSSGVALLMFKFLVPIVTFVAYYGGMYSSRTSTAISASYSRAAVLWSVELEVLAPTVGYYMRNTLWYLEPEWTAAFTEKFAVALATMESVAESLVYGSDDRGLLSLVATSPGTYSLMLENGCVSSPVDAAECALYGPSPFYGCNTYYNYAMCKLGDDNTNVSTPIFAYGVVGTGLFPSMMTLFTTGGQLVAARRVAIAAGSAAYIDANHWPITSAAHPGDLINELCNNYLAGGLEALSLAIYSEAVTSISNAMSIDVAAVVLSIMALFAFYLLLYMPLIAFLDSEIKRTRFLLLLVPEEVAKGVPSVVAASRKLAEGT